MRFDDAMELERLPRRYFESSTTVFIRYLIHLQPLLWCTNTTRHTDSDHETISRFYTLGLSLITDITIILLVYAVELGQLPIAGRHRSTACITKSLRKQDTQIA